MSDSAGSCGRVSFVRTAPLLTQILTKKKKKNDLPVLRFHYKVTRNHTVKPKKAQCSWQPQPKLQGCEQRSSEDMCSRVVLCSDCYTDYGKGKGLPLLCPRHRHKFMKQHASWRSSDLCPRRRRNLPSVYVRGSSS